MPIWPAFLFRPRVFFSRCRLRGAQGVPRVLTAQVWVPAGPRGERSGSSKSCGLASNHGIGFRLAEPRKNVGNPTFLDFALCCYWFMSVSHRPSRSQLSSSLTLWQPRYDSSRTSSSSLCDGASVCACACHVSFGNEHLISKSATDWMLLSV